MNENAERINGWAAMIGVIAAMGSYATTGQSSQDYGDRHASHSSIYDRRVCIRCPVERR